jgi:phosphoribosylamine-glycine ligase
VDGEGTGLSIAWCAAQAGHAVKWYVEPKPITSPRVGENFKGVEKVDNFVAHAKWADLIIATGNDVHVAKLTQLKKAGFPYYGPNTASAHLEISRKAGLEMMEKCGISVAPFKTFSNMEAAKKHVEKSGARWVFKTMGDQEDKNLTYCSKHAADMIAWIDRIIARGEQPKGEVLLQEFIEGVSELGVSRWMGKDGFVGKVNESVEYKKLCSGNYGATTGEVGDISWFTAKSKLYDDTLAKCEKELVKLQHLGDTAIGFIIDAEGKAWACEWTMRMGWPVMNTMLAATEGDPIEWMLDAMNGKDSANFREDIGCALVLTHGEFPHSHEKAEYYGGTPIYGITRGNRAHIKPQSVRIEVMPDMDKSEKLVRRPTWVTAGDYVAIVHGFGKTVRQATTRAYKTVSQLHLSGMQIRDDVGENLKEILPKLHALGFATHCNYE